MPRTRARAEAASSSAKNVSDVEPFASLWPMAEPGKGSLGAMESVHRMSEIQMDIARFAAERARMNVSTFAALATCRSPNDLVGIWRKAATDAVAAYADEAVRLLDRAEK